MRINRYNYEVYFLDWHEGNLDASMKADLTFFLEQNPDLKLEFENFENFQLAPDAHIILEDKEQFKKNPVISVGAINSTNYYNFFIAGIENDLNAPESNLLSRFLERNPVLASEYELLKKTVLIPDVRIIFEEKSKLKKSVFALYLQKNWIYYTSSIAAALIILIWISFSDRNTPEQQFVQNIQPVESVIPEGQFANADIADVQLPESIREELEEEADINKSDNSDKTEISAVEIKPEVEMQEKLTSTDQNLEERPGVLTMPGIHQTTTFRIVFADYYAKRNIPIQKKNTYSQLFEYIATADEYQLASNEPVDPEDQPMLSTSGLKKFKGIFKRKDPAKKKEKSRINFWTFADIGVYGFSKITNNDVSINRIKDEEGNIVAYALQNDDVQVSRIRSGKHGEERQAVQ